MTATGRWVLVVGVVGLVLGGVVGVPVATLVGGVALGGVAAAGAWAARRISVDVERRLHPPRGRAGEPVDVALMITNRGAANSPSLWAEDPGPAGVHSVRLPAVRPGASHEVSYLLPPLRRGRYELGPVAVVRGDPFGLVRSARLYSEAVELIVHPRVHRGPMTTLGRRRDSEGVTSAGAPEGGTAFHDLREYEPGDDPRRVHWRTVARTGRLVVRHNVDTWRPEQLVVVDLRPGDAFEEMIEVAASVTVSLLRARARVSVALGGLWWESSAGPLDETAVLDLLAAVRPEADVELVRLLPRIRRLQPHGLVAMSASPDRGPVVAMMRSSTGVASRRLILVGDGRPGETVSSGVETVVATTAAEAVTRLDRVQLRV